jgi:hypothetical protein
VAEAETVDPVFLGKRLEFAVAVLLARVAVATVLREQQVEDVSPCDPDGPGVGVDLDGIGDGVGAGGL